MRVTFWGVRGSCPCSGPGNARYGGNTACVLVEVAGAPPLILDLGTGLRELTGRIPYPELGSSIEATVLLSHLHWDHILGLPFAAPMQLIGATVDVYGPAQESGSLGDAFDRFMQPPFFPVHVGELPGQVRFNDVWDDDMGIGAAKVRMRPIPHKGPTLGFRIEADGAVMAYVSDHQAPAGMGKVDQRVLELCDGADLVVHDAQYTDAELRQKEDWGHSSIGYAVHVAREAGAKRLALFHHDPSHDDVMLDQLLEHAQGLSEARGLDDLISTTQGLAVEIGTAGPSAARLG